MICEIFRNKVERKEERKIFFFPSFLGHAVATDVCNCELIGSGDRGKIII